MNSSLGRDSLDDASRMTFSALTVADRPVFGNAQATSPNGKSLPPRRAGVPPRLLGDHPALIAQTSVPITASRPKIDHTERKKQVRATRRWDNAKMLALSFVVFGLIGGTIQWTRMGGGKPAPKVTQTQELKLDDSEAKPGKQQPQVASNNDTTEPVAWREQ